jgi:hypothetical protein
MADIKITPEDQEYIDYLSMLFDHNIRWNFKTEKTSKTLEEMKEMAKNNGLDINEWRKKNPNRI